MGERVAVWQQARAGTALLADLKDWPAFNALSARQFKPGRCPAHSALGANGLALGAKVELECWAWAGK